jgi:hypothetical protein
LTLLIGTVIALGYALQEGDVGFEWKTAHILAPAIIQAFGWVGFFWWEHYLTEKDGVTLPIWPTRLFGNRILWAAML